jgi:hypothetical protein
MKSRAKAKAKSAAKPKKTPKRTPSVRGRWRMSDLPPEQQVELRDRLEESKRGDSLIPFDEAMDEAERMADEIVAVLDRERQPTE